jgi:hypothetical protein
MWSSLFHELPLLPLNLDDFLPNGRLGHVRIEPYSCQLPAELFSQLMLVTEEPSSMASIWLRSPERITVELKKYLFLILGYFPCAKSHQSDPNIFCLRSVHSPLSFKQIKVSINLFGNILTPNCCLSKKIVALHLLNDPSVCLKKLPTLENLVTSPWGLTFLSPKHLLRACPFTGEFDFTNDILKTIIQDSFYHYVIHQPYFLYTLKESFRKYIALLSGIMIAPVPLYHYFYVKRLISNPNSWHQFILDECHWHETLYSTFICPLLQHEINKDMND